ncbi:hypothetical protein NDU88_006870 [Pleurodeles waltl]|uniref:Uncharacterized protein n=1 Tax=Pleurodeles waltl TaxID=8319 RepID=A0AAV7PMM6_PLEWA|nr:hypothetical protein NDU88_006870 [Pleurodeles waltl]
MILAVSRGEEGEECPAPAGRGLGNVLRPGSAQRRRRGLWHVVGPGPGVLGGRTPGRAERTYLTPGGEPVVCAGGRLAVRRSLMVPAGERAGLRRTGREVRGGRAEPGDM